MVVFVVSFSTFFSTFLDRTIVVTPDVFSTMSSSTGVILVLESTEGTDVASVVDLPVEGLRVGEKDDSDEERRLGDETCVATAFIRYSGPRSESVLLTVSGIGGA